MVIVLSIAGDQDPFIPLREVVGRAGITAPAQYLGGGVKVGMVGWLIVLVKVVGEAHRPGVG
ncbi:MAG: hypothetical protein WBO91_01505, partial [Saprospiraceae bacterium]